MVAVAFHVFFVLYLLFYLGAVIILCRLKLKNAEKYKKLRLFQQFYCTLVTFIPVISCSICLVIADFLCELLAFPKGLVIQIANYYSCSMAIVSTILTRMMQGFIVFYLSRFVFRKGVTKIVVKKNWIIWVCSFLYAVTNHETVTSEVFVWNGRVAGNQNTFSFSVCDVTLIALSYAVIVWKLHNIYKSRHLRKTSEDSKTVLWLCSIELLLLVLLHVFRFLFHLLISDHPAFSGNYPRWNLLSWLPALHFLPFPIIYLVRLF